MDFQHLFQIRESNSKICHQFLDCVMMQTRVKILINNYVSQTLLETSSPLTLRDSGLRKPATGSPELGREKRG